MVPFSVVYGKDQSYGIAAAESPVLSCIVLPTFVPVSDLSNVSSVLNITVLKLPIPKRNTEKYTGLKHYNKSKICHFALFCRGRLKRNRENIAHTGLFSSTA